MRAKLRTSETAEWPIVLKGVDVWPKAKWPRYLPVPLTAPEQWMRFQEETGEFIYAHTVFTVEEADMLLYEESGYHGKVEHAGSGFVRLIQFADGTRKTANFPIAEITLLKRAELPQGAC